jgi:hypothetical protein
VITGEAGIGKSRLVYEFQIHSQSRQPAPRWFLVRDRWRQSDIVFWLSFSSTFETSFWLELTNRYNFARLALAARICFASASHGCFSLYTRDCHEPNKKRLAGHLGTARYAGSVLARFRTMPGLDKQNLAK